MEQWCCCHFPKLLIVKTCTTRSIVALHRIVWDVLFHGTLTWELVSEIQSILYRWYNGWGRKREHSQIDRFLLAEHSHSMEYLKNNSSTISALRHVPAHVSYSLKFKLNWNQALVVVVALPKLKQLFSGLYILVFITQKKKRDFIHFSASAARFFFQFSSPTVPYSHSFSECIDARSTHTVTWRKIISIFIAPESSSLKVVKCIWKLYLSRTGKKRGEFMNKKSENPFYDGATSWKSNSAWIY